MIARIPITVPAAGQTEHLEIQGVEIIVEKSEVDTPTGVPLVRINSIDGDAFPAFSATSYRPPEGIFHRLYIEGTAGAAGTTLYLAILTTPQAQLRMASTVEL